MKYTKSSFPLLFILWPALGRAEQNTMTIMLENPTEIASAQTVADALDSITKKVSLCREQNPDSAQDCACRYPQDMAKLKAAVDNAIRKHPAWKTKAVSFQNSKGSHALSIPGLERQISMCQP